MRKRSRNSIWNRLKRSFLLLVCLPVLGLGSYIVYSAFRFVKEERTLEVDKTVEQNILDLNNRIEQCERSLNYVASNYTLQEFLKMDADNYLKLNQASQNVGPLLYNVLLSNQYLDKLTIYSEKNYSVRTDLIKNIEEVSAEGWFRSTVETADICWWYEENKIFLTKRIMTAFPKEIIGVIKIEAKDRLFSESFQILEDVPVRVKLNDSTVMYQDRNWEDSYYYKTEGLSPEGWDLEYEISKAYFYPHETMILAVPVGIIIIVLILAELLIRILLRVLVKDVEYLASRVEEVKRGNLETVIGPVGTEELNLLAASMNEMLERIRQLIEKVYQDELEQKELELEMLRSKISPHFLYNNLSAINWLAIEKNDDEIYEITTQMAAFYRTALNKGKKTDKLELEITNIKAYVNLQLISHENSFDVQYEIQGDTLECIVPTFILQPLVENAIEHGIDLLRKEKGILIIRALRREKALILEVEDNGKALYDEMGEGVLDTERYGYGTGNVHRRIQLLHGDAYGLEISVSSRGTVSRLRLKIDEIGIVSATEINVT